MKGEIAFNEFKKEIKRLQKKNNSKTILFIILGIVIVGLVAVLVIMRLKDKLVAETSDLDEDDEYVYYGDDDEDDFYEDYRALDYEDEEEM